MFLYAGNVLTAIELLPNQAGSFAVNKKGQVKLNLRFSSPLDENVTAVLLCQYQSVVEIDNNKIVTVSQ